ncbi:MAG: NrtA/SsuA/CpmA family ABC transporter substrate-binding protein [bacterium]|nr:NrtA/SsuA/CpmA family ABC transporter substrate-binding protein [bacterium]
MNKKIIISSVVILIIVTGFIWWRGMPTSAPKYTGPVEKVTVSNTEEYSTLIWIAENQGYFRDNGLEVITKDYPSGKLAADALLAGEADISVSADMVLVSNSFTNPALRILGTADIVDNVEVIAMKDRGIRAPSDLKGKKIGATKKSVSEFFLGTFLTFNHLYLADVEVIDVQPKDMADALLRGDVDAVSTWQPNVFNMKQQLGNKVINWSAQSGQKYNMLFLTKEKFIKDHPEAIKRFIQSVIQAEEFVQEHNEQAKDFIAKKYSYSAPYMEDAWKGHNFTIKLSHDLILLMEGQARWRIENKLTDKTVVPNYLNYIYFDALEAVKPEAVTIVH